MSKNRSMKLTLEMLQQLQQAYEKNAPTMLSFFSKSTWRRQKLAETFRVISNDVETKKYYDIAHANLARWEDARTASIPLKVEVLKQDWGDAALQATKQYGQIYPVLNFANDHIPGGDLFNYGNAQEENIWMRSTCMRSLFQSGIFFDAETSEFLYEAWQSQLIAGQVSLSEAEIDAIASKLNHTNFDAKKVFFNPALEVAFKGPELLVEGEGPEYFMSADPALSFPFLRTEDIFPFYEIRSAAPIAIDSHEDEVSYASELRKRISAQLNTLVLAGFRHAILGAWGCGCFRNDAELVAKIYQEEIDKYSNYFTHIIFPIINTARREQKNFKIFEQHLQDLPLKGEVHETPEDVSVLGYKK